MSNSTGSKEIPGNIQKWIDDQYDKSGIHDAYPIKYGMELMYRHLQEEKPKGMHWVSVNERLPEDDQNLHFTLYGNRGRGMIHRVYFDKWNVTHWLDESSDDLSTLRSENDFNKSLIEDQKRVMKSLGDENERLKGVMDEMREALEKAFGHLSVARKGAAFSVVKNILKQYPNPTQ